MQKTNEKKVLIFSAIAVVLLIVVVVGATYAFFTAQGGASANTNVNVQTNTTDNLSFEVGEAINITANQDNFAQGLGNQVGSTTASATLTANNATNTATRNYYLYLDITNNEFEYTVDENTPELILTITAPNDAPVTSLSGLTYKENVTTNVTDGETQVISGFDITTANGLITIADNYEISATETPTTQEWNVTVTFVNLDSDQEENTNKTFEATVIIQEEPYEEETLAYHETCTLGTMACDIARLYNETSPETNGLYYHDTNLVNGAQDNSYRYSGSNPNNYVCFGATGADCQNVDNQYRIIGVFDGQVKLIKATSYGSYAWNGADSSAVNTWDGSIKPDIYTTLNETYYSTISAEWQNLIAETTWQVGGMEYSNKYSAKQFYDIEVGTGQNGYEETMKIGLMYVSEYGYGTSLENWTTALSSYNNSTIKDNNWLYLGSMEWTISHCLDDLNRVHLVVSSGYMYYNTVFTAHGVRPSFYLNPDVQIYEGHSGTQSDPYRIVL